jgi:peptidoglycan-associated lipoprotein
MGLDAAVLYDANRSNTLPGHTFWLQGGSAMVGVSLWKGFGVAGDFAGSQSAKISSTGVSLELLTFTAGPQYKWIAPSRADYYNSSLFGHVLFGEAHASNSVFAGATGPSSSASSLCVKVGGGVDLDLTPRISLRVIQADWVRTQFPNGTSDVQNNIQLGAGVVIHIR